MDKQELAVFIKNFRTALQSFYKTKGYHENAAIQDYTTQIYWNILELQHRRLKDMGIELDFTSLQQKYTQDGPIKCTSFFDGKYEISEATEEISSTRSYRHKGLQIYKKKSNQLAYYTFLNAKSQGANEIVCPNCGNVTTRENLLDGCDYCHSKFTVEDLGARISSFALRSDWNITNAKYNDTKNELSKWLNIVVSIVGGIIGFILSILILPFTDMSFMSKIGSSAVAVLVSAYLATAVVRMFIKGAVQATNVDIGRTLGGPSTGTVNIAEELAKSLHAGQEMTDTVIEEDTISPQIALQVKSFDPLFSLNGFLSNIQNKLSAVIYAKNSKQINALSNCDLSNFLDVYKNIFEADILSLKLTDYKRNASLQEATTEAKLHLVEQNTAGHIVEHESLVELKLIKNSTCTTQAIRGPEILRCKCCGATLSLLEGKACSYCGQELKLTDYDWAISEYTIKDSKILITRV